MPIQGLTHQLVRSVDGTLIYADSVGNPSLPSIVFIHGGALSSIVFEDLFLDRTLLNHAYLVRHFRLFYLALVQISDPGALRYAGSWAQRKAA